MYAKQTGCGGVGPSFADILEKKYGYLDLHNHKPTPNYNKVAIASY